jgi:hypothetical protein
MGEQFPAILFSSAPVNKQGNQRKQTFRYPNTSIISWTSWCPTPSCAAISLTVSYPSVLSDELVDFLLVVLSCSSSRSATARLIGDVRVSVLKMFHPPSDTAGTHAGINTHTTKSLVGDSCRVSLFYKKFNDSKLSKQHVGTAIFSQCITGIQEVRMR